ncbi:MAG TPA: carbon monoxide dehydrogenase subunit G [Halobacteriales archaeon]|uniref:CoxG family protein n=1 Tax=Candidatus Hikarchaeum yamanae TaxID=2675326 RepID=UPI00185C8876|nr:carbon monoxide dehydrogenase subunit G [Halobacteriales archaeon]|tara:strand:+ start:8634 stop:9074 length:441 start_codon:yes stop_codon:yes gene_type:complete
MEFEGDILVPAERQFVFDEMQKPEMIQKILPNCESVEKVEDNKYVAVLNEKVSKISMKLETELELVEIRDPDLVKLTITGEAPGSNTSVQGTATFELSEEGQETRIQYTMDVEVSGKLASIGFRMIKHVAKKRIDEIGTNLQTVFQ